MVPFVEYKSQTPSSARQEVLAIEQLIRSGNDFTDARERHNAESFWQLEPVLQLGRNHVAVEIPARGVSSQLVIRSIDAVPIERRLPLRSAHTQVVSEYLLFRKASVLAEAKSVRLK